MRIFNKMKKMLLVAAALFAVNGAFAESKTTSRAYTSADLPDATAGLTLDLEGITVHHGPASSKTDGGSYNWTWIDNSSVSGYTGYFSSNDNPRNANASGANATILPTAGAFVLYNPTYDGVITTAVVANAGKTSYILEVDADGNITPVTDATTAGVYEAQTDGGYKFTEKLYGTMAFNVTAGKSYYVFTSGSKMSFYGFSYTYEEAAPAAADSLNVDEVTALVAGKTYVLGKQYGMYKVSFTAEKDGFLTIAPSQKVSSTSLKINGTNSTFTKVDGGIEKKGMAAGSVFEGTFYCSGTPSAENVYELVVTFEEGTPYSPLAMTLANPAGGGEWSGAAQYKSYGTKGVPHYEFSTLIATSVTASVKIGETVYENIKLTVDGYNPKLDITALPDTLNKAIAAGLIKAGETFTLTLSNIVDKEFAANTLADKTFTYTLASTACTGVSPTPSTSRTAALTDVIFSFDGNVALADTAKFYMVNLANNEQTALTGEVVEGTKVKVTVPAIEGLLPRLYNIVAEGVTTEDGSKVITYGNEPGKLVVSYGTSNGYFKGVTSLQNWGQVYCLKGFTATYPGAVIKVDGIANDPISITKWNMETYTEEEIPGVTLNYAISEDNPNVIVFTLSEPITEVGSYAISIPQKHFWAKDTYTEEDAKLSTPKYAYYQANITLNIDVVEPTVTDVTDKLVNPAFEEGLGGWNGLALAGATSDVAVKFIDGKIFSGRVVEHWEGNAYTGEVAQTVQGLPAGLYKFTFSAYVNGDGQAYVVANSSVSAEVKGAPAVYNVYAEIAEGEALKVGLSLKEAKNNWILVDNAKLAYYGSATLLQSAKADVKAAIQAAEALKNSYATPVEVAALDAAISAAKYGTVEEAVAAIAAIETAMEPFKLANDLKSIATATKADSVDISAVIVNPDARKGNLDGWTVEGNTNMRILGNEHYSNVSGGVAIGNPYFDTNAWDATMVGSMKQTIKNLPAGVYTLTAVARGAEGQTANVIINDNKVPVNVVGNKGGVLGRGWSKYTVSDTLYAAGDLTIGLELNNTANSKWFSVDEFALTAYMCDEVAAVVFLDAAVDSLNALVVETEAFQKTLDLTDGMQAAMNESLVQNITAAKAAAEAKESVAVVRAAYTQLNMMYIQIVANIAGAEAQAAQALMGEYENPTDEAGLANAITKVMEIYSNMMSNPENTYTVADLNAAVEAMRTAKDAFVKENAPITEVSVSLTHTASSYCEKDANAYISTVDAEKEYINNSAFNSTWQGAAYAEFSVIIPEGISIKSATLTWTGIGESRNPRNTDVYYVNAGNAIDYTAMQGGAEKVNLEATKITSVTFPKGTSAVFTTDVTSAVETIVAAGQNYIIFKFTGNPGGGHLAGKGDAANAPVLILETADASAMTTYTVTYVDGAGVELKPADVYSILIGETATLAAENKAAIYNEDKSVKYIYASCDKESLVTVADSASNVITATFREAAKYNYTVETTDDSGSLLITMGSYSGFEGENVKAPYNAYVLNEADSTLYESAKNDKEYNQYITLTEDNMKVQVAYTPTTIKNVVYYQEAENVEGLTKVTTGNTSVRSSNSASAYAAEADVVLTDLAPGKYKMTAVIYDATKNFGSEFSFIAGADTVLKAVSTAANWTSCTSGEFTLTANAALSLAKGGSISKAVDFVYIQKTGDAEPVFDLTAYNDTVAWVNEVKATFNAEDETEAELIAALDEYLASAAEWLDETLADPEATQEDVDYIAEDLKASVTAIVSRFEIQKMMVKVNEVRGVADSIVVLYPEEIRTDNAGLITALQNLPRHTMWVTSAEALQESLTAVENAIVPFQVENNSNLADSATVAVEGAQAVMAQYTEPTDEAGLAAAIEAVNTIVAANDTTSTTYPVATLVSALETLATAQAAFIVENTPVGPSIAYLCGATETTEAIYTALVNAGYTVTPLNYDATTLTEEIVNNDFVGKYEVVVLAGNTGSGTNLAKTANLLLGKVNVLSTKSFWYKHYGTNGGNPGDVSPSLNLAKVAGYEEHPIYAGIEGAEFAVFNESEAVTNGRYLQSNGSFTDIEQATLGTTNGANCIGEAWVDGKGWMIIPVDGDNSANFSLTADGAQLFVNAVDYLIAGEQFEYNLVEGVRVEATQWPADIYDLSGRMIKKAATSLEGLDKGLYFIQGKKVLVK